MIIQSKLLRCAREAAAVRRLFQQPAPPALALCDSSCSFLFEPFHLQPRLWSTEKILLT